MTYQHLLLCFYRQQPFTTLAGPDSKHQQFELAMMECLVSQFIDELQGCIPALILTRHEVGQSQVGYQLGIAQIMLEKLQAERKALIVEPVLTPLS